MEKMIDYSEGNIHDIEHFMKVHAYARLIGSLEGLDEKTQNTLELAAIVHDIACPYCRVKYGNASGKHQEEESEALLRPFLAEFELEEDVKERIIFLVCHHHTTTAIDGPDYQILIEADFFVNAAEMGLPRESIETFVERVAKTDSAKRMFASMFLR